MPLRRRPRPTPLRQRGRHLMDVLEAVLDDLEQHRLRDGLLAALEDREVRLEHVEVGGKRPDARARLLVPPPAP